MQPLIFWLFWCKSITHHKFPCFPNAIDFRSMEAKTKWALTVFASVRDGRDLSGWKLFSSPPICWMIFFAQTHTHTVWLMLAFFGHMWANKCNYEQDVITIALLLKLLYALVAWLTIYAGGWNCLLFSQEEKHARSMASFILYLRKYNI